MKPGYSRDIIAANIESEIKRGLSRTRTVREDDPRVAQWTATASAPHDWGTMDARDYQNAQSGGAAVYGRYPGVKGIVIDAEEV